MADDLQLESGTESDTTEESSARSGQEEEEEEVRGCVGGDGGRGKRVKSGCQHGGGGEAARAYEAMLGQVGALVGALSAV